MKKRNFKIATTLLLIVIMLFSTFSVAFAQDDAVTTTAPVTGEYPDEYWDGYYDGYNDGFYDAENMDYESGYNDGFISGYDEGYYQGYLDANYQPTIIDRLVILFNEISYRIKTFVQKLLKIGAFAPVTPVDPEADFIPDGTQATLEESEEAKALCEEFNALIYTLQEELPEPVAITKNVNVGITATNVPSTLEGIVNSLIENFLIENSNTNNYDAGDYAYELQYVELYPAGVTEATKTVNEDGTTDYKFVVIEEAAYYNGHYTTGVKLVNGEVIESELQHDYVADTLYIEAADLEPITISSAEIVYPGATITAKADAQGRLVAYDINMPVKGNGTAKIMNIALTASLEGYRNEGFVINYDL